jgi:hypothetical protein
MTNRTVGSPTDWIADATKAGQDLRDLIREAHEATRDLRVTLREVRDVCAGIPQAAREALAGRMAEDMGFYAKAIEDAIAGCDERMTKRYGHLDGNLARLEVLVQRRLDIADGNGK